MAVNIWLLTVPSPLYCIYREVQGGGPWSSVLGFNTGLLLDSAARRATATATARERTRRKCGRGGRFWCAFLATFARHWYTGISFFDAIFERFLNTQKRRYRRWLAEICHTRGGRPARRSEAVFEQGHRCVCSWRGEMFGRALGRARR